MDTKVDMVNNPPHYNKGKIETIDYIVDVLGEWEAVSYCQGNIIKYLSTRLFKVTHYKMLRKQDGILIR